MNKLILEEIQRMNLLSKYDNSKTLSEQDTSTEEQKIAYDFYDKASKGGGTNTELMRSSIGRIKNANQFWKVNDIVKKTSSGGMDIAGVINDELDADNIFTAEWISNHLKSIGIQSTYTKSTGGNLIEKSFKITTQPGAGGTAAAAAPVALPAWTKNYPCLSDVGNIVKTSDSDTVYHTTEAKNTEYFYENKSYNFLYKADNTKLTGTWDCVGGKLLIKTSDGEQWQKDTGWVKQKTNTANTAKKQVATPAELKDIKAFQDWLDTNAPGWATGYTDGIINKGQNGGGYGKYGPRTQKAWATYKDQYLNSGTEVSGENNTQTATATAGKLEPASGAVYGNEYVANDGKTYVWNGTEYQVKA